MKESLLFFVAEFKGVSFTKYKNATPKCSTVSKPFTLNGSVLLSRRGYFFGKRNRGMRHCFTIQDFASHTVFIRQHIYFFRVPDIETDV